MDDQPQRTQVLRYGQIIRIHGNYSDWRKGLLSAKGFTDCNVYYLTYQHFYTLNNYRESLFQVLPRGSFEIHDEFQKATTTARDKEILQLRLKTEADQYRLVMQNKINEEIIFGSEVIFKHIDSDQYLLGSYKCSEFSTDAFKLELTKYLSSLAIFKIQPYHSYQKDGQYIFLDEPVMLQHEKSKCLLDFVREQRIFIDEEITFKFEDVDMEIDSGAYERFRPGIRKPQEENHRYEAVATHNCQTNWIIKLHESYETTKEKLKLKPFDLCVFHHTQNNSFLSVEGSSNMVILKELKQQNTFQLPLEAVWELQPISEFVEEQILVSQPRHNSDMKLRLSSEGATKLVPSPRPHSKQLSVETDRVGPGGIKVGKPFGQRYILRHCLSGRVMTAFDGPRDVSEVQVSEIAKGKEQYFEVQPAKKGQDEILQNSFVKVICNRKELTIREQARANLYMRRENSFANMDMFFKSLDEENLDYIRYQVAFVNESMHAFQLQKIADETKQDLLFIMSSQEILLQFADILKLPPSDVEGKLNSKVLATIVQVLKQLLGYVLNLKDTEEVEKSECLPLQHRQRYMKDLHMIEVVMEILFFMSYKNGLEKLFKQWKSERERTKQIFKLSYMLIEKMTKNNPQIKLHVSQWLELFLHQAMMIDDYSVQTSLSELLDDNYQAISKFITKASLKRLVDIMRLQIPHEKYLRILSSICICNGKSIINNQIHALTLFFQQSQPEFRFQFRKEKDQVQVLSHLGKKDLKWRSLKQFYDDSFASDELQSWNYFLSYFNLLGDVCANRNKFAKKYVEDNFLLDILCSVIEDPDCLVTNAIQPFLKVIHFAYIDCQHYTPIRRLARVREWDTIEKKNDILRTHAEDNLKPENCDLKRVMAFIEKFIQQFEYFSIKNKNYNQNIYTILQVLKTTLRLGFWKSISNLINMLPHLFRICSCHRDFLQYQDSDVEANGEEFQVPKDEFSLKQHYTKAKSRLTKMNLENMMVMKCKVLACEILDIIIDMETNVRVSKTTQTLKKMVTQGEVQLMPPPSANNSMLQSTLVSPKDNDPLNANKKQTQNLSFLQERQQHKRKNSFLPQLLEKARTSVSATVSELNTSIPQQNGESLRTMNIFKNMASVFRKELNERDNHIYNVDDWIQKNGALISERNIFVKLPQFLSIEVVFAEMSLFENSQMLQYGLSLLNRIYGQRRELIQNFEKVLIVAHGLTFTLSVESRVTRTKLLALNDRNILQCTLDNQKDFNVYLWRESENPKESGIIQDLNYLVQHLKRDRIGKKVDNRIHYDDLHPQNGLREIYTERELHHKLHQSLLKSQDLHESILSFIQISKDIHSSNELIMKVLNSCYNYLTMLLWNHLENKLDMQKSRHVMYCHIQYNIGCLEFFREIFSNNKSLLFSEREVTTTVECTIKYANLTPISKYYKSKLMDFLRVCMVFNNKAIKANQILLMAKLQEKQNVNLMFLMKNDINKVSLQGNHQHAPSEGRPEVGSKGNLWSEEAYQFWIDEYESQYDTVMMKQQDEICISPELTYLFTYFQTFALLIEDRNEINAGKCKHMHPFPALLGLLAESKRCWPLKRYVRAYINRLYYISNDFENISQLVIEFDLNNIILDLQQFIDIKSAPTFQQYKNIRLANPVRYTYLHSYTYLAMEETLISLNTVLNKEKFLYDLEDILYQNFQQQKFRVHLQLFEIANKLACIRKLYTQCKYISHFAKILTNIFKSIFKTFDIQLLLIREGLLNSALQMKSVTEKVTITRRRISGDKVVEEVKQVLESTSDPTKLFIESPGEHQQIQALQSPREMFADSEQTEKLKEVLIENIFDIDERETSQGGSGQKLQQNLKKMFIKQEEDRDDINETLNQKHRRLINTLNLSSRFQRFMEEEFIQVCEKLDKIDEVSQHIYKTPFPVITLKEFIKNIIYMNLHDANSLKDDLKIFFLKVLARIITEKNVRNKETLYSIDRWTPEFWSDCKSQIEGAQIFLEDCGAAELICQLLKEPNLELRMPLTSELLIFAIAFLIGGNLKCQNSMLTRLKADQNNVMLSNYTIMIRKIGRAIYNNFKIRKTKYVDVSQFSVVLIDNFDYYDQASDMMKRHNVVEPDDAKETAFKKQAMDIICRSFRVLQLLCENNNVEMKNFIRLQTDSDETIKLNSINFIEFTTNQLRIFLKIMNKAITLIPSFMLDFLIEVIQLPCLENQITLCKSTFFEDACYMSQFFANKQNQQNRLFEKPDDLSELQELYNKILIAVMSVLEGNDEKIYEDLQNKLESRFLIDFIKQNLEILQVKDANDMTKLLNLQEEIFSDEIVKVLNVIVIKKKIYDKVQGSKWIRDMEQKIQQDPNLESIVAILDSRVRRIEIVYHDRYQKIFFPSHPLFDFLSDQTKDKLMYTINRETQREKILGLMVAKRAIFHEIEYNYKLHQSTIPVTHRTITVIRTLGSTVSVLINVLMVLFYSVVVKNKTATFHAEFYEELIIFLLSVIQLFLSMSLFIFYLISRAPLTLKLMNNNKEDEDDTQSEPTGPSTRLQRIKGCVPLLIQRGRKLFQQTCYLIVNEDDFIQFLMYLCVSIAGSLYKHYFFSLHLFDLFVHITSRLSLLKNVYQAISYNAKQLFVVAMLGVLFVFVFSITGFDQYVDEIYKEDEPDEHCETLISCMITLSTSGVIGTSMSAWDPVKFFLDTLYFVFFALLFTNIVSGIMIDTFAELRDQRQKIEDDKKNNCFICGIDRPTLEKNNEDFDVHILSKHFLWNYVFYMYTLTKKDSTEYTGLEYWISDKIKNEDILWYIQHIIQRFPMITTDNNTFIHNFEHLKTRMLELEHVIDTRTENISDQLAQILYKQSEDRNQKNGL